MTPRERATNLQRQLRDLYTQADPAVRLTVELVQLMSEDTKEKLVDAQGDDVLRLQGAAQVLKRLHKELTVVPPHMQTETA